MNAPIKFVIGSDIPTPQKILDAITETSRISEVVLWLKEDIASKVISKRRDLCKDIYVKTEVAQDRLAKSTCDILLTLRRDHEKQEQVTDASSLEILITCLKNIGKQGKAFAQEVRKGKRKGSDWWYDLSPERRTNPYRFVGLIASALWVDVVAPTLTEESRKPPALSLTVAELLTGSHSSKIQIVDSEDKRVLVDHTGVPVVKMHCMNELSVPVIEINAVEALLSKGVALLGTLLAQQLIRWEVTTGHTQVLEGNPDPRVIRVPGGWTGLAEAVGVSGGKSSDVHSLVAVQAHMLFIWPDGSEGNLLSYQHRPARRGHPGLVTLLMSDVLLPGYATYLKETMGQTSLKSRETRRLVPVTEIPPLIEPKVYWGPQAALSLLIVVELRRRARDVASRGGAQLDRELLERLAERVQLPISMIDRVIDRWTHDGPDGAAFLQSVSGNLYTLSSEHAAAQAFLVRSGQNEIRGAEKGRKSAKARKKWRT